jgi:hypothetical protein
VAADAAAVSAGVGGGDLQPMSAPAQLTSSTAARHRRHPEPSARLAAAAVAAPAVGAGAGGGGGRGNFGGGGGGRGATPAGPRVLLSFPNDPNDLLLSGLLVGGDNLAAGRC